MTKFFVVQADITQEGAKKLEGTTKTIIAHNDLTEKLNEIERLGGDILSVTYIKNDFYLVQTK